MPTTQAAANNWVLIVSAEDCMFTNPTEMGNILESLSIMNGTMN